jgi:glycosyltransferase involved in cell wall biosynthesis
MRICFLANEIFAWGKIGGFGRATRMIGRELVKRGFEVTAIIPRRNNQKPVEYLDGMRVLGFELRNPFSAYRLYKEVDADIYHSEEPSFSTYLAMKTMPARKHIITFQNTRRLEDWLANLRYPSLNRMQVLTDWLYEDNLFTHYAIHHANGLFVAAKFMMSRAKEIYHLKQAPEFLPTPVDIPQSITKSDTPLVCFVSRLDRLKRPEYFLQLAQSFPEVKFIAVGKSRDPLYEQSLRDRLSGLPNLSMPGMIDPFQSDELSQILGQSWILTNTSAKEGLPNAFIEAAAHQCAILSALDPDGFTTSYGVQVAGDDFGAGLRKLLDHDFWRVQASKGYAYVSSTFSTEKSIDQHIRIYQALF